MSFDETLIRITTWVRCTIHTLMRKLRHCHQDFFKKYFTVLLVEIENQNQLFTMTTFIFFRTARDSYRVTGVRYLPLCKFL